MIRNWIIRWFMNRRRRVFFFWDGWKRKAVDPLRAWNTMLAHPGFDFAVDLPAVERDDAESLAATVGACHAMFGTKSFDGKRGLTDIEAVELVTRFLYYMHDLKKNSDLMRTLPQSSESTPHGTSETTSNTSESSSTATESKPDDPTQS